MENKERAAKIAKFLVLRDSRLYAKGGRAAAIQKRIETMYRDLTDMGVTDDEIRKADGQRQRGCFHA